METSLLPTGHDSVRCELLASPPNLFENYKLRHFNKQNMFMCLYMYSEPRSPTTINYMYVRMCVAQGMYILLVQQQSKGQIEWLHVW